ncbi:hypothetical protein HHK36_026125 [Tetracentron sinense]|uniref:Uncharacterized protein n=1 Tax=Tetracentron sinense TaxID=13715 RepID=A0A834YMF4_TETSI|nr:hypothetical protein HHK36_026125 [Tetracentron sinense]
MARALSQTLIRVSSPSFLSTKSPPFAPSSRFLNHRNQSNRSEKSHLIEVDRDPESEVEMLGMRLDEAIHGIIVRKSAPDWLPFIPGSSYWVPPRKRPYGIVDLVGKLANPMTEEETFSLTTVRGWPSSDYFVDGMRDLVLDV